MRLADASGVFVGNKVAVGVRVDVEARAGIAVKVGVFVDARVGVKVSGKFVAEGEGKGVSVARIKVVGVSGGRISVGVLVAQDVKNNAQRRRIFRITESRIPPILRVFFFVLFFD